MYRALIPWLLGWNDQGLSFDIALHVGTVLAVIANDAWHPELHPAEVF